MRTRDLIPKANSAYVLHLFNASLYRSSFRMQVLEVCIAGYWFILFTLDVDSPSSVRYWDKKWHVRVRLPGQYALLRLVRFLRREDSK